jgi:hypothetical protein
MGTLLKRPTARWKSWSMQQDASSLSPWGTEAHSSRVAYPDLSTHRNYKKVTMTIAFSQNACHCWLKLSRKIRRSPEDSYSTGISLFRLFWWERKWKKSASEYYRGKNGVQGGEPSSRLCSSEQNQLCWNWFLVQKDLVSPRSFITKNSPNNSLIWLFSIAVF